jgi:SAM-dependent methyltransferase
LNPYLKEELVAEHLRYFCENQNEMLALFGSLVDKKRFQALVNFGANPKLSAAELLDLCRIVYTAPGDAANTGLPDQHIDFHTSFTVFEHVPPNVLEDILREGNRIIKSDGLFVHRIDYGDHFSYADKNISKINFLQYSDDEWAKYAGNRYMYMNRLRHDDFLNLFKRVGHDIVEVEPSIDERSEELLKTKAMKLHNRFDSKAQEVLAITGAWILTEKNG